MAAGRGPFLKAFGKDQVKVIVPREGQAEEIAALYGLETVLVGGFPERCKKRKG